MASRYWVGGTGNWGDTNHWSTTSGGSGGASVPTSSDDVFFDNNSGLSGQTVTVNTSPVCHDFISNTGTSYTINGDGFSIDIYGSLELETGLTFSPYGFFAFGFYSNDLGETIDTKGIGLNAGGGMDIWGSGEWTLLSDLYLYSEDANGGYLEIRNGIFDANDFNVTTKYVQFDGDNTGEGDILTPVIYMGNGIWEVKVDIFHVEEYGTNPVTIYAEGSTIICPGSFMGLSGGSTGKSFNILKIPTGSEANIARSNTFKKLVIEPGSTVYFERNQTQTIGEFQANGTASNPIVLDTFNGVGQHTLSKAGGTVSCGYLNIQDSNVTGGAWYAGDTSTNSGNNTGWLFTSRRNPFPGNR